MNNFGSSPFGDLLVNVEHAVKAYIRFDDAKVSKLSYESETRMFTMEPLPLVHRAPPQYDWDDVHDIAEWMTSLFIKLELAYDASRRD